MKLIPKLLISAATALLCASSALANVVTFQGTTLGAPTYNRLCVGTGNCVNGDPSLSGVGTTVHYTTAEVVVDMDGAYNFFASAAWDNYTFLYQNTFAPTQQFVNLVTGNDDFVASTNTSGFTANLKAGDLYIFVNTGYTNDDFGNFTAVIDGPGNIQFMAVSAVPEPGTNAMFLLGLGVMGAVSRRRAARGQAAAAAEAAAAAAPAAAAAAA